VLKPIGVLLSFSILLLLLNLAIPDSADFGHMTSLNVQGNQTIIVYSRIGLSHKSNWNTIGNDVPPRVLPGGKEEI
jgi:hypothetical protein